MSIETQKVIWKDEASGATTQVDKATIDSLINGNSGGGASGGSSGAVPTAASFSPNPSFTDTTHFVTPNYLYRALTEDYSNSSQFYQSVSDHFSPIFDVRYSPVSKFYSTSSSAERAVNGKALVDAFEFYSTYWSWGNGSSGSGGGSSITVDQTYKYTSANPQSGTAVKSAFSNYTGYVSQSYVATSSQAMSGKAVAAAISTVSGGSAAQAANPARTGYSNYVGNWHTTNGSDWSTSHSIPYPTSLIINYVFTYLGYSPGTVNYQSAYSNWSSYDWSKNIYDYGKYGYFNWSDIMPGLTAYGIAGWNSNAGVYSMSYPVFFDNIHMSNAINLVTAAKNFNSQFDSRTSLLTSRAISNVIGLLGAQCIPFRQHYIYTYSHREFEPVMSIIGIARTYSQLSDYHTQGLYSKTWNTWAYYPKDAWDKTNRPGAVPSSAVDDPYTGIGAKGSYYRYSWDTDDNLTTLNTESSSQARKNSEMLLVSVHALMQYVEARLEAFKKEIGK